MTAVVQIGSIEVRLACGMKRSGFCACASTGDASTAAAAAGTAFSTPRRRMYFLLRECWRTVSALPQLGARPRIYFAGNASVGSLASSPRRLMKRSVCPKCLLGTSFQRPIDGTAAILVEDPLL